MNITFPTIPADGQILPRSTLQGILDAITGYSIPPGDLSSRYAGFDVSIPLGDIASGGSKSFGLVVPSGETYIPVAFDLYYGGESSNPTASLTVTANASNVLNAALTTTVPVTVVTSNSFAITSIAATQQIIATVAVSGGDITSCGVTLHFKKAIRS
jgi:hypothetical protein